MTPAICWAPQINPLCNIMLNIQRSPKACYRWRENLPGCDCRPDRKMGFTQSEVKEDEKASYNDVDSSVEKQSDKAN